MPVLTLVDVLRIQDFVFASNRLRDVVAGSKLVEQATERALLTRLADGGEVIYAAGGNALLCFSGSPPDAWDTACAFMGRYSRTLLEQFPGLELEAAHEPFAEGRMFDAFSAVQRRLAERKLARPGDAALLGLSVTAECVETRRVASDRTLREDRGENALSAPIAVRRRVGATQEVPPPVPGLPGYELSYPGELDHLGRSHGETSLIGVVHLDGNRVGARIVDWLRERSQHPDGALAKDLETLSEELDAVWADVWEQLLGRITNAIKPDPVNGVPAMDSPSLGRRFPLRTGDPSREGSPAPAYLPIRRVLQGGDDLTFVCDGRIALALARRALEVVRGRIVPSFGAPIGACAGVAVVRSHAPFARAYELAEALCANAKRWLREGEALNAGRGDYALDWHIGTTAPLESLEALRERQYRAGRHDLTMRPYALGTSAQQQFTFAWLDEQVLGPTAAGQQPSAAHGFQDEFWQRRRNKVIALRTLVRGGSAEVANALDAWKVTADVDALPAGLAGGGAAGFHGSRTPLLDAIELLDLHHPLR